MSAANYGTWKSPITSDLLVQGNIFIDGMGLASDGKVIVSEMRPSEKGRSVLVDLEGNELVGKDVNVRNMVHEYGGAAFAVQGDVIVYSDLKDGRLYRLINGKAEAIVENNKVYRYANHDIREDQVLCIREDHTVDVPKDVVNLIVLIDMKTKKSTVVAEGSDFYSYPKFSPDGKSFFYTSWEHPNMPWMGSVLHLKSFGGKDSIIENKGSSTQPKWKSDGSKIYFCNDKTGFYNLYIYDVKTMGIESVLPKPVDAEFAPPDWLFGNSNYAFKKDSIITLTSNAQGQQLSIVSLKDKSMKAIEHPFVFMSGLNGEMDSNKVYLSGQTKDAQMGLFSFDYVSGEIVLLKATSSVGVDIGYIANAKAIEFPCPMGKSYGFLYLPKNKDYAAPKDSKPPLIVNVHGGPTGQSLPMLSLATSYWTSRGYAVCTVNYGGSTGYGKEFRLRLDGNWGIVDVDDSCACAQYLANQGIVDSKKMCVAGGSAGGYTTLAVMAFKGDVFAAGTSSFGISDLAVFANETHKFESHYTYALVGGLPASDEALYRSRSPLFHAKEIKRPLLVLQGADDKIVPANQAEKIVNAIKETNGVVEYKLYEGEGHGWRGASAVKDSMDREREFYERILNL